LVFKPTVNTAIENNGFSCLGHSVVPGVFDGIRPNKTESNESGRLLIQKYLVIFLFRHFGEFSITTPVQVLRK
jgi:hypothetical protein